MKKTFAISLVALAAISCNKIEDFKSAEAQTLVPMTFTAEIENTKAYIDGIKTYWQIGDTISVCKCITSTYKDAPKLVATQNGAVTTFTGEAPAGLSRYLAAYPASSITKWERASGSAIDKGYGTIKSSQVARKISTTGGVDNYIDPAVMYLFGTTTDSLNLTFKHPFAYIKFTVPENMTKKVKSVFVSSGTLDCAEGAWKDGKNICGAFNMNWIETNTYWQLSKTGTNKRVSIGNETSTSLLPGNYYIALYPREDYQRLTFDFFNYFAPKNVHIYKTVEKETPIKLEGGHVYDMGTLPLDLMVVE